MKKKSPPAIPEKKVNTKLVEKEEHKHTGLPNVDLKKFIGCGG